MAEFDFDVLIAGSGAGGGMTALSLCEQGFKVGLIERGPQFEPSSDYIQNYPDWETRRDPLKRAHDYEQSIDQRYRAPSRDNARSALRLPLNYYRVHGVGGSTLHYQGEAHRFAVHAFEQGTRYGWGEDWPIKYADLRSYYRQTEQLLGVAGANSNPAKPQRGEFPTPAHPFSKRSQLLARAATDAGMTLQPNTLALPTVSIGGRLPCQHSGGCNFGCVFNAKSSVDQAILPLAEQTGNLTLIPETRVLLLNLDDNGKISSLACRDSKSSFELSARRYVLAMGALETPRLMMHSATEQQPAGYANNHDQVGRYFMETVLAQLELEIELDFPTFRGPPIDSRIWDFCEPIDVHTSGFVLGSVGYLYPGKGPVRHAQSLAGIGRDHKKRVRQSFGKSLLLFGVAEHEPQADNRLTLSDLPDRQHVPRVKVHCEYSDRDLHTIDVMHQKLRAWQQATPGAAAGRASDTRLRSSATHVAGGCRMGTNAKQSVTDEFGKVHGKTNCYITDASVLPTQGAGDSPSLTIQALALRSAERLGQELRD